MRNYGPIIIISVTAIILGLILGHSYTYKYKNRNRVSVAGSAYYNFASDLIVWSASVECASADIKDAYTKLKTDDQQILAYLRGHGIADSEIVFSSISSNKQYEDIYNADGRQTGKVFKGYMLEQVVKVKSINIDRVEKVSREITELLQQGVEVNSAEPLYYYTKLADLKIDLLAKASADAYSRALTIAKNAHSKLGNLKEADMGVFQITGQYSNESFTYSGTFNTASKNKTANVIVRMEYTLE
ncbi:MAG: SIMPL domain-containing protein [Flavipsychrobacter sp.]|nr:SIMPL domain-containing protein [Flavipsychrobacter sp.]